MVESKIRGPYLTSPYIWVCEWCWKKAYLSFPDKMKISKKRSQGKISVEYSANGKMTQEDWEMLVSLYKDFGRQVKSKSGRGKTLQLRIIER